MIDQLNCSVGGFTRRDFVLGAMLGGTFTLFNSSVKGLTTNLMEHQYGLFGTLQAQAGKGADLVGILLKAAKLVQDAKGCIIYLVGTTADNPDAVSVFEVWDSKEDHDNSLKLPGVRELISKAMPMIAGKPEGVTLQIWGGKGLN
jgi:quinol monooxygenase YgiN